MSPTQHNPKNPRPQTLRGFTLVEIMVAITISLILLAGVMQIFLTSKSSYNLQDGMGRLQENARFALDTLERSIGMAGFTTSNTGLLPFNTANVLDNNNANAAIGTTVSDGNASDVIEVNFEAATDCLGNATGGTATERFWISGSNLMCTSGGVSDVIANGVENMQILYGDDTDGDGVANRYVGAGSMTCCTNNPVSVRIALLVSSVEGTGLTSDTNTYSLLGAGIIGPVNDNLFRRVFTRTILLRNQTL